MKIVLDRLLNQSNFGNFPHIVILKRKEDIFLCLIICLIINGEMDYRFHAAHLDRGLTIHEAVPGGFNRAGEGL